MATKPFTSEWEWLNINRGLDYTVVDNAQLKRNNWTLTRSRYSNMPYVSQLDERAQSLSGYNGGVPETIPSITGLYVSGVQFDTTTNWVSDSSVWIDSGYNYYGNAKTYIQQAGTTNKPDSSKTNVFGVFITYQNLSGDPAILTRKYAWAVVEVDNTEAEQGTFSRYTDNHTNYIHGQEYDYQSYPPITPAIPQDPDGESMLTANGTGTFTGTSTPYNGSFPSVGTFLCTADSQSYQQRGVDWYQQVQTWSFKDGWITA